MGARHMTAERRGAGIARLAFDAALGIVYVLLFCYRIALGGATFHEVAGLAFGGAALAHVLANKAWVSKATRAIFRRRASVRTCVCWAVDVALAALTVIVIALGVFCSRELLPQAVYLVRTNTMPAHIALAWVGLALIGVHLGLHRRWLLGTLRRMTGWCGRRGRDSSRPARIATNACMVALFAFGIWMAVDHNLAGHVAMIGNTPSATATKQRNIAIQGEAARGGQGGSPSGRTQAGRAGFEGVSPLEVIAGYGPIMGAFAVGTGYADMAACACARRRRRP